MRENEERFSKVWNGCGSEKNKSASWEDYCNHMQHQGKWGGRVELTAIAHKWNTIIAIVHEDAKRGVVRISPSVEATNASHIILWRTNTH